MIDWQMSPVAEPGAGAPDPYAVWAATTKGAYLAGHASPPYRVALRLFEHATLDQIEKLPGVSVPKVYQDKQSRYCTADVSFEPGDASTRDEAPGWHALRKLADVALAEPGMAEPDAGEWRLDPIRPAAPETTPRKLATGVVIGVIDGPCGFANRQFRRRDSEKWKTTLTAIWDQGESADKAAGETASSAAGETTGAARDAAAGAARAWTRPSDFGYGRELTSDALDVLFARHLSDSDDDEAQAEGERALYRALAVPLPAICDWSHGTHILDTVAGPGGRNFIPPPLLPEDREPEPSAKVETAGVIVVQLPEVALRDTSGRWAAALVLDGLRYIVARADDEAQIVVNISLGAFAGPHDGSSMIERAIDALIAEIGTRLTVVVAAGNAREPRDDGDGTLRPCDAQALLPAAESPQSPSQHTFAFDIDLPDATETFVEVWLRDQDDPTTEFPAVDVKLVPPGDLPPATAKPGQAQTLLDTSGSAVLAQVINLTGRDSCGARGKGPMALVAIGPTRDVAGYRAPLGRWSIAISNDSKRTVAVEAWIERRDVPGELAGERPQYGFVQKAPTTKRSVHGNTMGSLASGASTIAVAAAEFPHGQPPRIATISSRGPQGAKSFRGRCGAEPLISAPCEFAAAGFLSGSYKTLKGTSMSAAWITRVIASEILARGGKPPPDGVRKWLLDSSNSAEPKGWESDKSGSPPTSPLRPHTPPSQEPAGNTGWVMPPRIP